MRLTMLRKPTAGAKRSRPTLDPRQLQFITTLDRELVNVPEAPEQAPASHDHDQRLRRWLNEAIEKSPLNRDQIASAMTVLGGRAVSKPMLDTWTGAGRPNRFPMDLVAAFCLAVGNNHVMEMVAGSIGARIADTVEAQLARLGQWALIIAHAQQEQRALAASLPALPLFGGR
jgi:hypothetical protein